MRARACLLVYFGEKERRKEEGGERKGKMANKKDRFAC